MVIFDIIFNSYFVFYYILSIFYFTNVFVKFNLYLIL
nr:MAG TPA: hypothetical protein [Caudoviricetes sp.]